MRSIILFFFMIFAVDAIAGTCTSISRTNNSSNQVLTSTKYNLDHNTSYAAINSFDGGCTQTGTLEKDALNTTDFEVPLKAIRQGCNVTYSDANTVSVAACMISVNGAWVKKDTATTVTWGGSSDAEANSTTYYVYAANGSSGGTLNLLLKTTAPNGQGYDASGNVALARIYNNSSGDISSTIHNWGDASFVADGVLQQITIKDVKADGTDGGTCTSGSWATRVLNTVEGDTFSGFALASNQFTLPAGRYLIMWSSPGFLINDGQSRLYNLTTAAAVSYGQSVRSVSGTPSTVTSNGYYTVDITSSNEYRVEFRCETTRSSDGYGQAGTFGGSEIYTIVTILKIR
jgi:hypothetical protein